MREYIIKSLLFSLFFVFNTLAFSQDKDRLENQREQLLQQIAETNQMLSENKTTTSSKLSDLKLLKTKLKKVNQLVESMQVEMNVLNTQIEKKQESITRQEDNLEVLRTNYSKSLVNAYKLKSSMSEMVFVLSSSSFNAAFRRMNYLRKLNQHRNRQAESIKLIINNLETDKQELIESKDKKNKLLVEQSRQQQSLEAVRRNLAGTIAELKEQGDELNQLLTRQQEEEQRLQAAIQAVIAKEIAAKRAEERKKAEESNSESVESVTIKEDEVKVDNTVYDDAPSTARLSNSFASNKGKLPWPLDQGVITSSLGEYGTNDLPGIKKERDGIDIRTNNNSMVKSVFSGQVRSVTTIPGFNKVVIISHGDYYTVYGNLESVFVAAGDDVTTGDQIGIVENKEGVSELHLQIWKLQQRLNPSDWLTRK